MAGIFISYRRADSISATGRLHEYLTNAFGADMVFKDVEDIPPGVDFRQHLKNSIEACNIVLVIIGNRWVNITDAEGNRRLFAEDDWVRTEVATALHSPNTVTIPVLVEGAAPPQASELPDDIKELAYRNAFHVRNDPDFPSDASKLIELLRPQMPQAALQQQKSAQAAPTRRVPIGWLVGGALLGAILLFALLLSLPTDPDPAVETEPAIAQSDADGNPQQQIAPTDSAVQGDTSATALPTAADIAQQPSGSQVFAEDEILIYADDSFGYSFEFPNHWEFVAEFSEVGVYAVEGDDLIIFIYEFPNYDGTLQDLPEQINQIFSSATIEEQQSETSIPGTEAIAFTWTDVPSYRARALATIIDGTGLIFSVEPVGEEVMDEARQEAIFDLLTRSLLIE